MATSASRRRPEARNASTNARTESSDARSRWTIEYESRGRPAARAAASALEKSRTAMTTCQSPFVCLLFLLFVGVFFRGAWSWWCEFSFENELEKKGERRGVGGEKDKEKQKKTKPYRFRCVGFFFLSSRIEKLFALSSLF